MRGLFLFIACAVLSATSCAHAQNAQDIVASADTIRIPSPSFRMTNTLVEYVDGKPRNQVVIVLFAKEDKDTHHYKNLLRYIDPPRDSGKMVLMNGSNMWFYDPSSKASVRISPQQRLIGQASDGDVVTTNFVKDYAAQLVAEEKLEDADRVQRLTWHLNLTAATAEAVYNRIEYWVEKGTFRPIKGKFYSDSGRLLKTAYYRKYEEQLGRLRPSQTIIIDAVDQKLVTTITSSDLRAQAIADSWFQRDYLPHVKLD